MSDNQTLGMSEGQKLADRKSEDPFFDRRSGYDRRLAHDLDYFAQGGIERRVHNDRRSNPFLDRRCGDDRRQCYDLSYFAQGGTERRTGIDRRKNNDRHDHGEHMVKS